MISRNRSAPTTEAMSIESTTSAKRTVTCLYSAWVSASLTGEPQLWQNRAFSKASVPHVRHAAMAVTRPSANPGPRSSQDRRLDTPRGAVGYTIGDTDTKFCQCHADGVGWLAPRLVMPLWL